MTNRETAERAGLRQRRAATATDRPTVAAHRSADAARVVLRAVDGLAPESGVIVGIIAAVGVVALIGIVLLTRLTVSETLRDHESIHCGSTKFRLMFHFA